MKTEELVNATFVLLLTMLTVTPPAGAGVLRVTLRFGKAELGADGNAPSVM